MWTSTPPPRRSPTCTSPLAPMAVQRHRARRRREVRPRRRQRRPVQRGRRRTTARSPKQSRHRRRRPDRRPGGQRHPDQRTVQGVPHPHQGLDRGQDQPAGQGHRRGRPQRRRRGEGLQDQAEGRDQPHGQDDQHRPASAPTRPRPTPTGTSSRTGSSAPARRTRSGSAARPTRCCATPTPVAPATAGRSASAPTPRRSSPVPTTPAADTGRPTDGDTVCGWIICRSRSGSSAEPSTRPSRGAPTAPTGTATPTSTKPRTVTSSATPASCGARKGRPRPISTCSARSRARTCWRWGRVRGSAPAGSARTADGRSGSTCPTASSSTAAASTTTPASRCRRCAPRPPTCPSPSGSLRHRLLLVRRAPVRRRHRAGARRDRARAPPRRALRLLHHPPDALDVPRRPRRRRPDRLPVLLGPHALRRDR